MSAACGGSAGRLPPRPLGRQEAGFRIHLSSACRSRCPSLPALSPD